MRLRHLFAPLMAILFVVTLSSSTTPGAAARMNSTSAHDAVAAWLVVLDGAPVAAAVAGDRATIARTLDTATIAQATAVDTALAKRQHVVTAAVEAAGAQVVDGYRAALNALLVIAPPSQVASIARVPGVQGVWRAPLVHAPATVAPPVFDSAFGSAVSSMTGRFVERTGVLPSTRLLDAPAAIAQDPPTLDGSGMLVAVAGTGVDYLHAAFGGAGDAEAFTANDPGVVEAGSFPTARVVGGYDLAGPRYTAACPNPVPADELCSASPEPDDDPLDEAGGSGTASAGIVATGAPGAGIVALDIFGSPLGVESTSALHIAAIDWVVRHNSGLPVPGTAPEGAIDVLILPSGAAWGGGAALLDDAVDAASAVGVAVIAPAGDSGDVPFAASAPSTARAALAVGAAFGPDDTTWGIRADWIGDDGPAMLEMEAVEAQDPWATLASTGAISGTLAWYGLACNEDDGSPSEPAQDVTEKIALIERGTCAFADKVNNAEAKGAVAALLFTDQRGKTNPRGGNTPPGIPSLMVDRPPGLQLRQLVEDGVAVTVLLDPDYEISLSGLLLPSSARGPARGGGFAPDVVADGANVLAPVAGGGDGTRTVDGTAPAAARVAALAVKVAQWRAQEGKDWSGGALTAMIAANAEPGVRLAGGAPAPVSRQGAGLVDADAEPDVAAWSALRPAGAAPHDDGPAGIDVGAPRVTGIETITGSGGLVRRLTLEFDDATKRYAAAFERSSEALAGASVTVAPNVVAAGAAGPTSLDVTLQFEPSALAPWTLHDGRAVNDPARLTAATLDGHVVLREIDAAGAVASGPGGTRVIPLRVTPRPGSCMAPFASSAHPVTAGAEPILVPSPNTCAGTGELEVSRIGGVDAIESGGTTGAGTAKAAFPPTLDIAAVGLRFGQAPPEDPSTEPDPEAPTWIEFHVQTAARRHLAPEAAIDVLLDLDRDGTIDRILTTVHGPDWRGGFGAGDWRVLNTPPIPGTLEPDTTRALPDPPALRWDLDESVTVIPMRAEETLIDPESGEESFDYAVRIRDAFNVHPVTADYPGEDLAPDGAADGALFTFEQDEHACIAVRGPDGERIDQPGRRLTVPPNTDEIAYSVTLDAACPADADYGLLYSFPRDGEDRAIVRWLERADGGPIYMPYTARNAE